MKIDLISAAGLPGCCRAGPDRVVGADVSEKRDVTPPPIDVMASFMNLFILLSLCGVVEFSKREREREKG